MCHYSKNFRKRRKRPYAEQRRKQAEAWDAIAKPLVDNYLPTNVFDAKTVCLICAKPCYVQMF